MGEFGQSIKRQRMTPPLCDRVMLYVRQENEDVYTPLHVIPPTTVGLLNAVSFSILNFPTPHSQRIHSQSFTNSLCICFKPKKKQKESSTKLMRNM